MARRFDFWCGHCAKGFEVRSTLLTGACRGLHRHQRQGSQAIGEYGCVELKANGLCGSGRAAVVELSFANENDQGWFFLTVKESFTSPVAKGWAWSRLSVLGTNRCRMLANRAGCCGRMSIWLTIFSHIPSDFDLQRAIMRSVDAGAIGHTTRTCRGRISRATDHRCCWRWHHT